MKCSISLFCSKLSIHYFLLFYFQTPSRIWPPRTSPSVLPRPPARICRTRGAGRSWTLGSRTGVSCLMMFFFFFLHIWRLISSITSTFDSPQTNRPALTLTFSRSIYTVFILISAHPLFDTLRSHPGYILNFLNSWPLESSWKALSGCTRLYSTQCDN